MTDLQRTKLLAIAAGIKVAWDMRSRELQTLWHHGYICRVEKQWASLTVKGRKEVNKMEARA
jgi:Mn-dependent DtxR family transcriptional regulator